uniref:Uncharacterized protein n=1 Tax=Solanum tuberosum TaxID=4113 RepID=M1DIN7_SOLTU
MCKKMAKAKTTSGWRTGWRSAPLVITLQTSTIGTSRVCPSKSIIPPPNASNIDSQDDVTLSEPRDQSSSEAYYVRVTYYSSHSISVILFLALRALQVTFWWG